MAPNVYKRKTTDGATTIYTRKGTQGRKPSLRKYVKVLVRVPAEYYELMRWNNEKCGGLNSVTEQIRMAIRSSLCGCVYTQLLKH
jgi:hypothetical protein